MAINNTKTSAAVLGGSINPLSIYVQQQANRRKNEAAEAERQRDETSKLLDYNEKFKPETTFFDLNKKLNDEANAVRDKTMQWQQEGRPLPEIMNNASKLHGAVNSLGKEMDGWQQAITEKNKEINQHITDGRLKEKPAKDSLRFGWRNNDGSVKDIPSVRQFMNEGINTIQDNPDNINPEGAVRFWVDNLKDQAREMYSTKWNDGYSPDDIESVVTSKLKYERIPDGTKEGQLKYDKNGNPIPIIDNTTLALAKQDPFVKKLMDTYGGESDESKAAYLKNIIVPGSDIKSNSRQIVRGHKLTDDDGSGAGQGASIVGAGDNALKPFANIGADKQVGFDSISFGYSSPTSIPISTTQGGAADKTGAFSGLRTNPSTGKKEMEFITPVVGGMAGEKEIKFVPYDEKTFQQVLNTLPKAKRDELRKLKTDFDTQFANKKEYVLDEDKLNTDVDKISKYYTDNEDNVETPEFDKGLSSLLNELGVDKKGGSVYKWFTKNKLKIGSAEIPYNDKEKIKEILYDLQKGKYKKAKGASATPENIIPHGNVR